MRRASFTASIATMLAALGAGGLQAAEISRLDVGYAAGRYRLEATAEVAVAPEVVYAILTDYANLHRLDPQVLESKLLERPGPGVALVWLRARGCVLFICRELEQVQRVDERSPQQLVVDVIPERSDIPYEHARWLFEPTETGTKLDYVLEIEPGSWVPFFGRGSVQRQLRASFRQALAAIETLAGERAQ